MTRGPFLVWLVAISCLLVLYFSASGTATVGEPSTSKTWVYFVVYLFGHCWYAIMSTSDDEGQIEMEESREEVERQQQEWRKEVVANRKSGYKKVIFVQLVARGKQWEGEDLSGLLKVRQAEGEINLGCGSWKKGEFTFFKAHRVILEQRSEYCRKTFEDVGEQGKPVFLFEKIQPKIMIKMLDFMYTGKVTLNRNEELDHFMEAVSQLEVSEVQPQREYYCYVPPFGERDANLSADIPKPTAKPPMDVSDAGDEARIEVLSDHPLPRGRGGDEADNHNRQVWLSRTVPLSNIFVGQPAGIGEEFGLM